MANMPAPEVAIDEALVSGLVAAQRPDLLAPVAPFANGWDNALYSLGDDLLVRLPRRRLAVQLLEHEIEWLSVIALNVNVPLPVPVFVGQPGCGYPWHWTIVPRLPGRTATELPVADRAPAAGDLARFFAGLHRRAPSDAPLNPFRGAPLADRQAGWEPQIRGIAGERAWQRWLVWAGAPHWPGPHVWLHGDPHPLNLLLDDAGHLSGVIDWGDVTSGDPASDLAAAWLLFDEPARERFIADCGHAGVYDPAVWERARAWALGLACVFATHSDDHPELAGIADHALAQLT